MLDHQLLFFLIQAQHVAPEAITVARYGDDVMRISIVVAQSPADGRDLNCEIGLFNRLTGPDGTEELFLFHQPSAVFDDM